jgi:hypothetical protein
MDIFLFSARLARTLALIFHPIGETQRQTTSKFIAGYPTS